MGGATGIAGNDCCGWKGAGGRDGVLAGCLLSVSAGKEAILAIPPATLQHAITLQPSVLVFNSSMKLVEHGTQST